jgi:phage terminase small subunit
LTGHKSAASTWRRIVALYFEVDGKIITAFDEDLLVKYCILEEECLAMEKLRDAVLKDFSKVHDRLDRIKPKGPELKEYYKALEQVNALLARYQGLDARLDGKRKLLHALAQSLYLTPRSRAGVAPPQRQPEKPDGFGKEFD